MFRRYWVLIRLVLCILMLVSLTSSLAQSQSPSEPPSIKAAPESSKIEGEAEAEEPAALRNTFGRENLEALIRDVNPMLIPLAICSVVALGFTLERTFALRRRRVIPKRFVEPFFDRLTAGQLDRERAMELCRANGSVVARIFATAVRHWGQPSLMIRQAVDADSSGEVSDLRRNVRVLNGTATLAPLLGLLGTVVGLIEAFDSLGGTQEINGVDNGKALAHGISLALVATAFGLTIAAGSVVAYYFLLNRVELVIRALDDQVRRLIEWIAVDSSPGMDRPGYSNLSIGSAERARRANTPQTS